MAIDFKIFQFLGLVNRGISLRIYGISLKFPKNRFGDCAVSLARFYHFHGRLPYRIRSFNDILCRMQMAGDLDDCLRILTTDKEFSKEFLSRIVGPEHVVDTIAVIHNEKELSEFMFPKRCCVKGTAGSGLVKIVEDGMVDRQELSEWFDINQYDLTRERNYKPLTPKIIVEPLIFDNPAAENIKFFVVNGKVKLIQSDIDRFSSIQRRTYDRDWNDVEGAIGGPIAPKSRNRPGNIEEMIQTAESVGAFFEFVRVDMYTNDEQFFMGEVTHNHGASVQRFFPPEAERRFSHILFADDGAQICG